MRGKFVAALMITGFLALLPLTGCKQKTAETTAENATANPNAQGTMDYPILLGNDKIADKFGGILGLPTSMLYSRDGKKVKTIVGIMSRDDISKALESQLESGPGATSTASAPEGSVTIPALDGSTVTLDQYKGKVVLVNFWATWCEPCKAEIPWLIEFNHKYGPKGLVILGIAMDDEGKKVVEPWVKSKRFEVNG
jgi:thiol-disulfide isomerase/thioredoxin